MIPSNMILAYLDLAFTMICKIMHVLAEISPFQTPPKRGFYDFPSHIANLHLQPSV